MPSLLNRDRDPDHTDDPTYYMSPRQAREYIDSLPPPPPPQPVKPVDGDPIAREAFEAGDITRAMLWAFSAFDREHFSRRTTAELLEDAARLHADGDILKGDILQAFAMSQVAA